MTIPDVISPGVMQGLRVSSRKAHYALQLSCSIASSTIFFLLLFLLLLSVIISNKIYII